MRASIEIIEYDNDVVDDSSVRDKLVKSSDIIIPNMLPKGISKSEYLVRSIVSFRFLILDCFDKNIDNYVDKNI